MTPKNDDARTVQVAIRIPSGWVPLLQKVAERLSHPGIPLTQADAMRAAIFEGLEVLRVRHGVERTPVNAETADTIDHGIRDAKPKARATKGKK
jgi:hypothetical protein